MNSRKITFVFLLALIIFFSSLYMSRLPRGHADESETPTLKVSSAIDKIQLTIAIPQGHKLIPEAKPYIRLRTRDERLKEFFINDVKETFVFDEEIGSDELIVELRIYFCPVRSKKGVCVIHDTEIRYRLDKSRAKEDLMIDYSVPMPERS